MGRSESKQVVNQGTAQSSQDQANAQKSLGDTNSSIADYKANLGRFMNFGRQTYGEGGDYQRTQNTLATTAAGAGHDALEGDLALRSMRTGENTSGYATAASEDSRARQRDVVNEMAQSNADRLKNLSAVEQYGVDASKVPAEISASLYGTGVGGANAALGNAANAARTPGFWDTMAPAIAQGAGTAIAGFCPCAGSMIRMADGTDKPIEEVRKGDYVWALSTSAPPNPVLETPLSTMARSFAISTEGGRKHRGSETHTVALAIGGYGFMPELAGQVVMAESDTDMVTAVEDIGAQVVYPLKLGGSHIYMADGIWVMA